VEGAERGAVVELQVERRREGTDLLELGGLELGERPGAAFEERILVSWQRYLRAKYFAADNWPLAKFIGGRGDIWRSRLPPPLPPVPQCDVPGCTKPAAEHGGLWEGTGCEGHAYAWSAEAHAALQRHEDLAEVFKRWIGSEAQKARDAA
jgi:hypothetical protein